MRDLATGADLGWEEGITKGWEDSGRKLEALREAQILSSLDYWSCEKTSSMLGGWWILNRMFGPGPPPASAQ